jgi:hypothetical protein
MPTRFPHDSPGAIFERGLTDKTDVYLVTTGAKTQNRVGVSIPLFYVEAGVGERPDADSVSERLELYTLYDPQKPHLLSYAELGERFLSHQVALSGETDRQTDEFNALIGLDTLD